jgi:GntR family transcriptional regulator, transcriptional repressor for pyruvate dehydrogenase complex
MPAVDSGLFEPVRTRKTFEDVIGQIVDRIRSGHLREGDLLPGERVLANAMDVSRPTIRLAVSMLAEAGVLQVSPGRGGGIRVQSMWIPDGLLAPADEFRANVVFDLLEARRTLEPRLAQMAAARATDEQLDEMQRTIELQESVEADRRKLMQADQLFHRIMWQAAGNPPLDRMMNQIFDGLSLAFDRLFRTEADRRLGIDNHADTLTAMRRGDPEEIDRVMDHHLSYLEHICEDAFQLRRVREVPTFLRSAAEARPPAGP